MIGEIEYYKGDVLLYGNKILPHDLKNQLIEIENSYDKTQDNFIDLFCRRFGWTILYADAVPDFTYDRDTRVLMETLKRN